MPLLSPAAPDDNDAGDDHDAGEVWQLGELTAAAMAHLPLGRNSLEQIGQVLGIPGAQIRRILQDGGSIALATRTLTMFETHIADLQWIARDLRTTIDATAARDGLTGVLP